MKKIGVEEIVKKLTLWHTATFRPIISHDDLEPIMASAGFFQLPFKPNHNNTNHNSATTTNSAGGGGGGGGHVAWREYDFGGKTVGGSHHGRPLPRPRLPYPRVDGLHLLTYQAFFNALGFYLGPHRLSDLFHVRSMPVTKARDRVFDGRLRPMRDCNMDDEGIFVYRDGTLDHITQMVCSDTNNGHSSPISSSKANSSSPICLVSLEDLFPGRSRDIVSLG